MRVDFSFRLRTKSRGNTIILSPERICKLVFADGKTFDKLQMGFYNLYSLNLLIKSAGGATDVHPIIIDKLKKTKLSKIVLYSTQGTYTFTIDAETGDKILRGMNCMKL